MQRRVRNQIIGRAVENHDAVVADGWTAVIPGIKIGAGVWSIVCSRSRDDDGSWCASVDRPTAGVACIAHIHLAGEALACKTVALQVTSAGLPDDISAISANERYVI